MQIENSNPKLTCSVCFVRNTKWSVMHHASNDLHCFLPIRHRNQHRVHWCQILNSMFQIELYPKIKFRFLLVSFWFDYSTFIVIVNARIFFNISLIQFIRFVFASFESVHSLYALSRNERTLLKQCRRINICKIPHRIKSTVGWSSFDFVMCPLNSVSLNFLVNSSIDSYLVSKNDRSFRWNNSFRQFNSFFGWCFDSIWFWKVLFFISFC